MFRNHSMFAACTMLAAVFAGTPIATADDPETVLLPGTIRDFHKTNTDFVVVPSGGYGHYAGNVGLVINGNNRPSFAGNGFKVSNQWRNSGNEPIPPHLYAAGPSAGGVVAVVNMPTITGNPTIDSFNPDNGPYGGSNVGPPPQFVPGSPMPSVSEPTGLPALVPKVEYSGNGTSTLNADLHCSHFILRNNRTLNISGDRTILVEDSLSMENYTKIKLLNNASLKIYFKNTCFIDNHVDLNVNTADPSRLTIINLGSTAWSLGNYVNVYAEIISPNAALTIQNNADLMGTFTGLTLNVANSGGFHNTNMGGATPMMCSAELNDTAGSAGVSSTGGIPSGAAFNTWYTDVPGVNLSAVHSIELVKSADGIFEYLDDSFHPVDNLLFGNEDEEHNHYFTYMIEAQFIHHACQNSFFEFQGADDAWLFLDGKLGMDLGGVIPGTKQYVEIDRIPGLQDGQTYSLMFFYAQRQPNIASFNVRTNLDLIGTLPSTVSAGCD